MGKHTLRRSAWRRWSPGGAALVLGMLTAVYLVGGPPSLNRSPGGASAATVTDRDAVVDTGTLTSHGIGLDTAARQPAHPAPHTAAPVIKLRPGRFTRFRAGVLDELDGGAAETWARVQARDLDLLAVWSPDLALDSGWAGYPSTDAPDGAPRIAWRTDTWRVVRSGVLHVSTGSGETPVQLVRLANRDSQRWVWVAALPRTGAIADHPGVRLAAARRALANRLRPERTPFLLLAGSSVRFAGEGLKLSPVGRDGSTFRADQVTVRAG